ncbi:hypothetical protein BSCH_02638 [Candidatus Paraburkholderia schumanniana]|nr:hypothetical protein BSCH_02638 [Candidatus Paraburkholderia schumannianae]
MSPVRRFVALLHSRALVHGCVYCAVASAIVACSALPVEDGSLLYRTAWRDGPDPKLGVQANPGDVAIVGDPSDVSASAIQTTIRLSEGFSKVENGVPRAELMFPAPVRLAQGKTYFIRWSTMLPPGTQFDSRQFVIITQINQGSWLGGLTVALALQGTRYAISQRGGVKHDTVSAGKWLCCADADVGKWVHWELIYRPQEDGENAITELRRDGRQVFLAQGVPNAYPGVQNAYLKIGLYKPD